MKVPSELSLHIEEISNESEEFLRFLDLWSEDVEVYFPDFSIHDITFATVLLLKINSKPSGLFIYQDKGEELHIDLDYLIPDYRNMGIGDSFFRKKLDDFKKDGFEIIISVSENPVHQKYLKELGFEQSKLHNTRFEYTIS